MHGRLLTGLTIGVAALLVLSGCQDGDTAITPPPSISGSLPTTSGSATFPTPATTAAPSTTMPTTSATSPLITVRPTTPADIETLAKEAEQVYLEYKTLRLKYEANAGENGPQPADLKQFVDGEEAVAAEKVLRFVSAAGTKLENVSRMKFIRVGTFMDKLEPQALIGVQICEDASEVTILKADGSRGRTANLMHWSEFARGTDGNLQIVYSVVKEVSSCDA